MFLVYIFKVDLTILANFSRGISTKTNGKWNRWWGWRLDPQKFYEGNSNFHRDGENGINGGEGFLVPALPYGPL